MSNVVANRFRIAARAAQALSIGAIGGGAAALYWNRVYFCGSSLGQLLWPKQIHGCEPISAQACRLQLGVPYCHSQLHTVGAGVSLLAVGLILYWLAHLVLSSISTRGDRSATTWMMWGLGLALFGAAIVPVEHFAVAFDVFQSGNGIPGGITSHVRMTRYPGAVLAFTGIVTAAISWRRSSRTKRGRA